MNDPDPRLWHPWLRINRVLRAMLHERWSAEAWPQIKAEFKKALALKSQIRRAGCFDRPRGGSGRISSSAAAMDRDGSSSAPLSSTISSLHCHR